LLGLPAAGKSELRRYLAHLDPAVARRDFRLCPPLHLDDYPYVHLMRRVSAELRHLGADSVFFDAPDLPFRDRRDWATLTLLLADDVAALGGELPDGGSAGEWLLRRFDGAAIAAGIGARFDHLDPPARRALAFALDEDAGTFRRDRSAMLRGWDGSQTVLIEMARGGPEGAELPLPEPLGYQGALHLFPPEVLEEAGVLYVWVTSDESRRKNQERAVPGADGSILHHGVPEEVMRLEYGTDDFFWLLERGGGRCIPVVAGSRRMLLPAAVFDNREDKTSFLRDDSATWPPDAVRELHELLRAAMVTVGVRRDANGAG